MAKNKQPPKNKIEVLPPLRCCGVDIAPRIKRDGKIYLVLNDWEVTSAKKHCPRCGGFVNWTQPRREVPRLEFAKESAEGVVIVGPKWRGASDDKKDSKEKPTTYCVTGNNNNIDFIS